MKLYQGHIELWPGKVIMLPRPMTWMEISQWRFGPMLLLPLIPLVAGAGMQVAGTMAAAKGQEAAGAAAAAEAQYNAQLAEREAEAVEQRTAYQQRKQAEEAERRLSTLQAGFGAAGAVTAAGSPLLIAAKQASEFELENLMIGYEGRTEAARARSEAVMQRQRAKTAKQIGKIQAGTTLLTGFGQTATMLGSTLASSYKPKAT